MINQDTYINILFAIIIATLLGAFITIYTQPIKKNKKRKIIIAALCIGILLIIIDTIIFLYESISINISSLFITFNFSNLFPFYKSAFTDTSFNKLYWINICISVGIFLGLTIIRYKHSFTRLIISYNTKKIVYTFSFSILIISYLRIWTIYLTCNLLHTHIAIWACYIILSILYIIFTIFELRLLDTINRKITIRKLSDEEYKNLSDKLTNLINEEREKLDSLKKELK